MNPKRRVTERMNSERQEKVELLVRKLSTGGETSVAAAAWYYRAEGFGVLPLPHASKACRIPEWPHYSVKDDELAAAFQAPCNVGVLLGGSGYTDVDVDSELADPFLGWLPPTRAVWGRASRPRSHHLYRCIKKTRAFKNSSGVILEIRSQGCYAVVPPSVHPTGESYVWNDLGEPGDGEGLEVRAGLVAMAATLLLYWQPSRRHAVALAVAGLLLSSGWSQEEAVQFMLAVGRASGDTELDDRRLAVLTTDERIRTGQPVAGFAKLAELIGREDARRIADWAGADGHDLGDRASTAKSVKEKRQLAQQIRQDLETRGVFYRTHGADDLLFFHKPEHELYPLGSRKLRALCSELYGINGREPIWSYLDEELQNYCVRSGSTAEFFRFARYQDGKLYVHAGGHVVYRLDGKSIKSIDNGEDGVLFEPDPTLESIDPDFQFQGNPVRECLVHVANAIDPDRLLLYEIYIYSLFFEALLPTKPIVLFTGPKGSGKTSAGRALKRALFGRRATVDTGMASKEDAYWAGICAASVICMDNVDSLVTWLADALAVVATGGKFKRRKLYETNTVVEYVPRCFVMITSRNPQSFTRDDVVDRLLLIEVERRKDFIPESDLLRALDQQRNRIWGQLLITLNNIVAELQKPVEAAPLEHRLADWAKLAVRFGPILGIHGVEEKLRALESSKVQFALDDSPVVQGLEDWIAANPKHDFIASGDLYQAITAMCEAKGQKFGVKSARIFGMQLKNFKPELGTRYNMEEKAGPNNKKLFRFSKKMEHVGNTSKEKVAELESQL
jgi:hypothetical protein